MEFFDYSLTLFEQIEKTDFSKFFDPNKPNNYSNESQHPLEYIIPVITNNLDFDKFNEFYRKEVSLIFNNDLSLFIDDSDQIDNLNKIYFYDKSVSKYTWMYLFWIWFNKVDISNDDLKCLLKAVFMGMMGFRLLDIATDDENQNNKEYFFLGHYLIRSFEKIYMNVFKTKETFDVLNYYLLKYNEVEYTEKRNLWKTCPFNWDESNILGYKTSPLLALFEVIFVHFNVDTNKSKDLIHAFLNMLAINQIIDDIGDAESDLLTGRETLVMKGFFEQYGTNQGLNQENIQQFLSHERLFKIYKKINSLFDNAIDLASKHDDLIFVTFIEIVKPIFLNKFVVVPKK
jgi:hypothetical protein